MKIALLIHGGVDRSGTDRVIPCVIWLIEQLAETNEVHVFAFDQEREPATWPLFGATVRNVGSAPGWRRRLFSAFNDEHRRARFDVIQSIFTWGGIYGTLLSIRHGIPMVFYPTGGELVSLPDIGYGLQRRLVDRTRVAIALRGARRVVVSSHMMQRHAAALGLAADVVPMGIATKHWPVRTPRRRTPQAPAQLLHVGDVRPVKDHRTLFEAAHRMQLAGLDFRLRVAGLGQVNHGGKHDGAIIEALGSRVQWLGVLPHSELRAHFEESDVIISSSRHESAGQTLLEGAVAGVPMVGTNVGYVADFAPDAAVAVPVADPQALADATMALLADEDRRLCIAHEAQRRALAIDARYTASRLTRTYAELGAR